MDGTWPGSVKFSPPHTFQYTFQHYTHTQPFATKHFLYDVRTVEQNISLCFPHLDFSFFLAVAWKRPLAQGGGQKELAQHQHSIYIFFFLPLAVLSLGVIRGCLLYSSLLFSYPPSQNFP